MVLYGPAVHAGVLRQIEPNRCTSEDELVVVHTAQQCGNAARRVLLSQFNRCTAVMAFWAAWYITRLLVKLTPKGVVFLLFSFLHCCHRRPNKGLHTPTYLGGVRHSSGSTEPLHWVFTSNSHKHCIKMVEAAY